MRLAVTADPDQRGRIAVAVEMDGRIVKRAQWETLELAPGAKLEIVQFVGGG